MLNKLNPAANKLNPEATSVRAGSLGAYPLRCSEHCREQQEMDPETLPNLPGFDGASDKNDDAPVPDSSDYEGNPRDEDDYSKFAEGSSTGNDSTDEEVVDEEAKDADKAPPNTEMLEHFRAHCNTHSDEFPQVLPPHRPNLQSSS